MKKTFSPLWPIAMQLAPRTWALQGISTGGNEKGGSALMLTRVQTNSFLPSFLTLSYPFES